VASAIALNPWDDPYGSVARLLEMTHDSIRTWEIPTQNCVLSHVTTQMQCLRNGVPVGLVFQSLSGSQKGNDSFGISVGMLDEAYALAKKHCVPAGPNYMYFETGQGSALSADANNGWDQLTLEARNYGLAKRYSPYQLNTVVGFIGPAYLYASPGWDAKLERSTLVGIIRRLQRPDVFSTVWSVRFDHAALASGLAAVAITDHDCLDGVRPAQQAAAGTDLEVIAGVEISTEFLGRELHLLAYWVDLENVPLAEALRRLRDQRVRRFWDMVERLRAGGIAVDEDLARRWSAAGVLGRRHLAMLLRRGAVTRPKHGVNLAEYERSSLGPLFDAIQARDFNRFRHAYEEATAVANRLHVELGHPDIVWRLPGSRPEQLDLTPQPEPEPKPSREPDAKSR